MQIDKKTKKQLIEQIENLIERNDESREESNVQFHENEKLRGSLELAEEVSKDLRNETQRLRNVIEQAGQAITTYDSIMFEHSVLEAFDVYGVNNNMPKDKKHDSQEARFLRTLAKLLSGQVPALNPAMRF